MALSDYTPERREIKVKGKPLCSVEGLSLEALSLLIKTHLADMDKLFEMFSGSVRDATLDRDFSKVAGSFIIKLVTDAPALAANLIAVAAGEANEKGIASARGLPFPVQVEVLHVICELTFGEEGGIKKAFGTLAALLGWPSLTEMVTAMESMKDRSSGPTGASAAT